jgi:serine/threonine protein phosphatase PrpC
MNKKNILEHTNVCKIYDASLKGKRPTNQDKHLIYKNNKIDAWCICDGHGSTGKVSDYLVKTISKLFSNNYIIFPINRSQIIEIYTHIQNIISKQSYGISSGSTCLLVIKYKNILYTINVGDSRAIIYNTEPIQLSVDHKPINPDEKKRIIKLGGQIEFDGTSYRVNGLSLSRAFGDADSNLTFPTPDISIKKLTTNDKFIVLGCDGLFDLVHNDMVCNFVLYNCFNKMGNRINTDKNIAEQLANYAINNGSTDNVSVIVIFL